MAAFGRWGAGDDLPASLRLRIEGWTVLVVMTILSFGLLAPNLLLFSTDDLDIYCKSQEAGIAISQAGVGRYTLHFIARILQTFQFDYTSYLIISTFVFSISCSLLYYSIASILSIDELSGFSLGFVIYVTFGLNLDLFQFTYAYMAYGLAFTCVAGVLWVSHHVSALSSTIILTSIISFLGIGSYQLFAHLLIMAVLALYVSSLLSFDGIVLKRVQRTISLSLLALITGTTLYLAANFELKIMGIADFDHYPVREQGLKFARINLSAYGLTLLQLVNLSDPIYRPLLPQIWRLALAASILQACTALWRQGFRYGCLGTIAIVIAFVLWPNPANLFLKDYWPSARSMSGFCLFLGIICGVVFRQPGLNRGFETFCRSAIIAVAVCQCVLFVIRYQDRIVQQEADIALAQSILLHADTEFPINKPIMIDLAIAPDAVQTAKPIVFDYGRSLFATSWSAPALLDYLSGHRVLAQAVDPRQCGSSMSRLSYEKRGDRLLVCLVAR